MSSQPSQEVQLLLAAEKRAIDKVGGARKRKAQLLKKAKEEAAADIEQFKAEQQIVFTKYETEHIGSKDDVAKRIDRETTERLATMQNRMQTNQAILVGSLMDRIVDSVINWSYPPSRMSLKSI